MLQLGPKYAFAMLLALRSMPHPCCPCPGPLTWGSPPDSDHWPFPRSDLLRLFRACASSRQTRQSSFGKTTLRSGYSIDPFPTTLNLNTPKHLIRNILYMVYSLLGGWGCLVLGGKGLSTQGSCTYQPDIGAVSRVVLTISG